MKVRGQNEQVENYSKLVGTDQSTTSEGPYRVSKKYDDFRAKNDALWEYPLGKGEATCHSSPYCMVYVQKMCGRLYKSSSFTHDANGREHSTCCRRNLCIRPTGWSQYSISLRTYHPWHSEMSVVSVSLDCGVLISSTSYSGFYLSLVQLIAWAEDTCIGLTLRFCVVSSTLRNLFSTSDESAAINSWRRV